MPERIGKYRIVERIGHGGMGMIFKAHDPVLDRLVALKVISTDAEITDELRARFFREAQACAQLSHPNIVTIYAMGDEEGQLFIVMELLEGEELKRLISDKRPLALEDKLSIMIQVCEGLDYAHRKGIVHRDIKPSNIFLLRNGRVKILDFGIARLANAETGLTRAGLIMGSLRYISPEQVRGGADHRSDLFSVGAVFYELLTMRPAFGGEDPLQVLAQLQTEDPPAPDRLDPAIPPALSALVMRAMRKAPAERFPDLGDMRSQLEAVERQMAEEAARLRYLPSEAAAARAERRAREAAEPGQTLSDVAGPRARDVDATAPMDTPGVAAERAAGPGASAALGGSSRVGGASSHEALDEERPSQTRAEGRGSAIHAPETARLRAAPDQESISKRSGHRRRAVAAAVGALAALGLAALALWLPRAISTAPPIGPSPRQSAPATAQAPPEVTGVPSATPSADRPRDPPSSTVSDKTAVPPATPSAPAVERTPMPRQALQQVFEGRNRAHSVTAAVVRGRDGIRLTITSSRPGYVYVLAAHSDGSAVEWLPDAGGRQSHIEPGHPLTLSGPPLALTPPGSRDRSQLLAMVSDEPRDFSGLSVSSPSASAARAAGPVRSDGESSRSTPRLAGTVARASATPCSESYGAAIVSMENLHEPDARVSAPRPPATTPPAARARPQTSSRCSDILERASLGEPLTDEEQTMMTRDCR